MGLDITAVEIATLVEDEHPREDAEGNWCGEAEEYGGKGHIHVYIDDGFEHALGSLLRDRCYQVSGDTMGFRAGSYSGYNWFREALSKAALGVEPRAVWDDPDSYRDKPFVEMINFSDCEGVIGPEVCAELAKDFRDHREDVREALVAESEDGWYGEKYDEWQAAFELAADTGLVQFH